MSEVIIIGLDVAKNVFHVDGADKRGRAIFSKRISRGRLLDFFVAQVQNRSGPSTGARAMTNAERQRVMSSSEPPGASTTAPLRPLAVSSDEF